LEDEEMPREDKGAGVGREWALEVARGDLRAARGEVLGCGGGILFFLELHTTVIPVIFSVSVFPGIFAGTLFLNNSAGIPFFLQKEGEVYKEGAEAPPSWEKGGSRQFFEGLPPIF